MNVTIAIPDDVAIRLGSEAELERRALEALCLEEYRAGRLTRSELGRMLGLADGSALDGLLKDHGITRDDPTANLKPEQEVLRRASEEERRAADELVARFKAFAARHTLGGLSIKELIEEGRP